MSKHDSIDPHEYLASDEFKPGEEYYDHSTELHVTPFWPMFWVFAILLFLTALTVWTSNVHEIVIGHSVIPIGSTPHIIIALVIASVKAFLVAGYFMHLKYDKPVNTIVVAATLFGVALFIGLTIADFHARGIAKPEERGEIRPGGDMSLFSGTQERLDDKGAAARAAEGSIVQQSKASAEAARRHSAGAASPDDTSPEL